MADNRNALTAPIHDLDASHWAHLRPVNDIIEYTPGLRESNEFEMRPHQSVSDVYDEALDRFIQEDRASSGRPIWYRDVSAPSGRTQSYAPASDHFMKRRALRDGAQFPSSEAYDPSILPGPRD